MKKRYLIAIPFVLLVNACSDWQGAQRKEVDGLIILLQTTPAPLQVGSHADIRVKLKSDKNQPSDDCKARFRQFMPGMEMSLDKTFVEMTAEGDWRFKAQSAEFSMGGDWVIELTLACNDKSYVQPFTYHLEWPE
ncbi:MAG: FixH family protein [Gammaproteobacteria bacterium]